MAGWCGYTTIYSTITANRVYKAASTHAFKILRSFWTELRRTELVFYFIRAIGVFPVGTLVRLKSQRLGIVIQAGGRRPAEAGRQGMFLSQQVSPTGARSPMSIGDTAMMTDRAAVDQTVQAGFARFPALHHRVLSANAKRR